MSSIATAARAAQLAQDRFKDARSYYTADSERVIAELRSYLRDFGFAGQRFTLFHSPNSGTYMSSGYLVEPGHERGAMNDFLRSNGPIAVQIVEPVNAEVKMAVGPRILVYPSPRNDVNALVALAEHLGSVVELDQGMYDAMEQTIEKFRRHLRELTSIKDKVVVQTTPQ